jgi:hypothetical protein
MFLTRTARGQFFFAVTTIGDHFRAIAEFREHAALSTFVKCSGTKG